MDENQVQQTNTGTEETEPQVQDNQPKMISMTQQELDDLIAKRLSRQERKLQEAFDKKLNELSEAQKLAQMDEKQKAEYQTQKEREAFEEERKAFYAERDAFNRDMYKAEIQRQLNEAGLPDVSDMLVSMDAEQVKAQIDVMKASFNAQVNASVEAKIKSSANTPTVPQEQNRLLTLDEIKAMTTNEYMANRELVEKSLKALRK